MKTKLMMALAGFALVACQGTNTKTARPGAGPEQWESLFDGTTLAGWRAFNGDSLPASWIIEDGTLKSLGRGGDIGGDIVYAGKQFANFDLQLEWKIAEGGNSGIFYHVQEGKQYAAPYFNAPEYQVIDQLGFPEKLEAWQSIGADYGMYDPDFSDVVKPAGEWNTSRIVFTADSVVYYLNGKKTVNFVPWSDDWNSRRETGKWKDYPDYGKARSGLIGLQDHGSFVWYRNIKIREL